jgi:hypothetical protein
LAAFIAIGAFALLGNGLHAQDKIQVGANTQVSKTYENLRHNEVLSCADPHNADRLIVGSIVDYFDHWDPWTMAYVSVDGGKSWSPGVKNHGSDDEKSDDEKEDAKSADPACAYGPDGSAYFVAVHGQAGSHGSAFFRSPDGGKKWLPSTTIFGAGDRPFIAVDNTGGKYDGRIYVDHTKGTPDLTSNDHPAFGIGLQRSLDNGRTFLGPIERLSLGEEKQIVNPGNTVITSDGTVFTLLVEFVQDKGGYRKGKLEVVSSLDGGERFGAAVKVADYSADSTNLLTIPNIAVDPGSAPFKDRLYVVWQNAVKESGTGPDGEISLLSYSADHGKTWSKPERIDNLQQSGTTTTYEYQTTVGVNKEGVVGVMWYDGFDHVDTAGYQVRFSASMDGGNTWLPSVLVSESPTVFGGKEKWAFGGEVKHTSGSSPIELHLWPAKWISSGHTAGLSPDTNGVFHAFWIDNRTGVSQVWTAPIRVTGSVLNHRTNEPTAQTDLSTALRLEIGSIDVDRSSGNLSLIVRVENVSESTVRRPLKLEVLGLRSQFGVVRVLNAENKLPGVGAVLDLSPILPADGLKPHERSAEIKLLLRIEDLKPLRSEGTWNTDLLTFEARMFSSLGKSPSENGPARSERRGERSRPR